MSKSFNWAYIHTYENVFKYTHTTLQYVSRVYTLYTESMNPPTHKTNALRYKIYVYYIYKIYVYTKIWKYICIPLCFPIYIIRDIAIIDSGIIEFFKK